MTPTNEFLDHPGRPGPFGALMDEYARAAGDLCSTVETVPRDRHLEQRPSDDPDTVSIQEICRHVVNASLGYSNYIRGVRGLPVDTSRPIESAQVADPRNLRGHLHSSLRYTEESLEGLYDADEKTVAGLSFQVRWGPTYDPEMILEHAIVHLLRHRRQIERWVA
jgi:uncharacterized damage-inducible protein DinB